MTQRIALGGLDLTLNTLRFNPDAQYANCRDVQQLLSGDNHGGAPGDNSDSLTTIYWGIPRQFPKTLKYCRIAKDVLRLTKKGIADLVMEIACGLHNFRVSCPRSLETFALLSFASSLKTDN